MSPLSIARVFYDDGRYRESIAAARSVLETDNDATTRLRAFLLIANSHWALDESQKAAEAIEEAGPLVDSAPFEWRGRFYGTRALLHRNAGRYDEASIDYEAARFCALESGDQECEASVRNNLAKVYSDLGRYDDALKEVDAAINLGTELNETVLVGQFYDLKAQICLAQGRHEDSLRAGCEALKRLRGHPASDEAQRTHAQALEAAVSEYLSESDPVQRFNLRRVIVNGLNMPLDSEIVRMALNRSKGHVYKAAKLLNVKHQSLQPIIEESDISRVPKRRRARSLIKA